MSPFGNVVRCGISILILSRLFTDACPIDVPSLAWSESRPDPAEGDRPSWVLVILLTSPHAIRTILCIIHNDRSTHANRSLPSFGSVRSVNHESVQPSALSKGSRYLVALSL